MKIGDRCFVHGYIDEIRKDTVIIRNEGGYFGTDPGEVIVVSDTAHPNWIPVSEKLPETEEFVLTSLTGKYRNTTFEHACEIADYADGEWCVYAYPHMSAEKCAELIEAWMPLPEPYKPNK